MIDWQIQPLSRTCAATGQPLEEGERVTCFLFRDEQGQLQRADVRGAEAADFTPEGVTLGRWGRTLKPRNEEEREAKQQALASAEELFMSLAEASVEGDDTRDALLQILALLLERKRVLKEVERPEAAVVRFKHAKTGQTFDVPMHEIAPTQLIALQGQLEALVR